MKKLTFRLAVVFAVALAICPVLSAQEPYKQPPKEVVDIVSAPPTPMVSMSPAGDTMALIERESMPSIAYLAEPLLMIHGMADNDSGTFPIQSERLFAALKGFGATVRFVYLPYESHGYSARESVLHVLAEMFEWFDRYVKNKK